MLRNLGHVVEISLKATSWRKAEVMYLTWILFLVEYPLSGYVKNSRDSTACIAQIEAWFTAPNGKKYLILSHAQMHHNIIN